jgi:hypothetical protein
VPVGFPLLQKSTGICVDRQINVPGSFWTINKVLEEWPKEGP